MKGRKHAFGLPLEEELDDFRLRASGQYLVKLLERDANNLRSRGFRIAGLTEEVNEGIDPFRVGRVIT